jgi:hypothetical protein
MASKHDLQVFFLERLGRLVELHESMDVSWSPDECCLVDHALLSTYRDCERVGLRPVARAVLSEMRRG